MFDFTYNRSAGLLQVRVSGSWTIPEIERYAREAGPQFASARKDAGLLRYLIDLRAANILSQEMMEPLGKAGMQYARADDRIALVVGSTLLKLQMRRMLGDAPIPIFISAPEATTWLLSDDKVSTA
jgi:hypothetical protein